MSSQLKALSHICNILIINQFIMATEKMQQELSDEEMVAKREEITAFYKENIEHV